MFAARKKSPLESRLRELEKESNSLRSDMKVLSRAIKKPENLEGVPRLKSRKPEPRPPSSHVEPPAPREREPSPPQEEPPKEEGGLFSWRNKASRSSSPRAAPARSEPPEREFPEAVPDKVKPKMSNDERFRNYFGHG
ncbi:MAG: hypothetical protein V2A34_01675, partial [Lentisphaerota bacterium]